MKKTLEEKLVKKYPKLYKNYKGDPRETCLAFGFQCGDGWYNIIEKLSEELSKYDDLYVEQVKEKFAGLRFYISAVPKEHSEQIYKHINEAEEQASKTCEVCGKPGQLRKGSWLRTLCDKCHDK